MLGEKPITLDYATSYVSHDDPAIDWDRIIAREHERDPGLQERIAPQVSARMALRPKLTEAEVRREIEEEAIIGRVGQSVRDNPAITLEEYVPLAGQRVTVFRIGVVPADVLARIEDETAGFGDRTPRPVERYWRCFLSGIRGLDNFGSAKVPMHAVRDVQYVDPKWLADTFVGPLTKFAGEVGFVVWMWNRFSEEHAKK